MGILLDRVLEPYNMRRAWNEVAENQGMAGVDDVSIQRWRRNWEERLVNLTQAVRGNRYKPSRLRVRRIPKKTPGEWRVLRVPTVTDRVIQRAVLQVLHDQYEPWFLPCSYGYRPGRSLKDAVQQIIDLRQANRAWVLDADIDDYFNSVDHERLEAILADDLDDPPLIGLIRGWLKTARPQPDAARGIPMGSPLSPLLANVYLHHLDRQLTTRRRDLVRYADDFVVLTVTRPEAQAVYQEVEEILADLKLCYEPRKTRIASFEEGFSFLGVHFYRDTYSYEWEGKQIEVKGDRVDWLFSQYGPTY